MKRKSAKVSLYDTDGADLMDIGLCIRGFLTSVKYMESELKLELIKEAYNLARANMVKCLVEEDPMANCADFNEKEESSLTEDDFNSWFSHPEKTVDLSQYQSSDTYRKGVKDAIKLCRIEILCRIGELEEKYKESYNKIR